MGEDEEAKEGEEGTNEMEQQGEKNKEEGGKFGGKLKGLLGKAKSKGASMLGGLMSAATGGDGSQSLGGMSLAGSVNTTLLANATRKSQLTKGLGELRFSMEHCRSVARVSGSVYVFSIKQESGDRGGKVNVDQKTMTREELLDQKNPPLVVTCMDPMTSGSYVFHLKQSIIEGSPLFKGKEHLFGLGERPLLARFVSQAAGRLFAVEEREGRKQLVIQGETNSDKLRLKMQSQNETLLKLLAYQQVLESKKRKLQNECRVLRLEEYRVKMAKKREASQRSMLVRSVREWQGMHKEDVCALAIRPYLTCDDKLLTEIRVAFEVFDLDGNGTISHQEFQALVFELGEVMTEKELAVALAKIDLDGNGVVQFHEFATWWVTKPSAGEGRRDTQEYKMLALKLKMLKRAKGVAARISFASLGGGGKKAKMKKAKKDMLTPLQLSRVDEDGKKGGGGGWGMGKLFGGGGGKKDRPGTV
jgi:hypothetical protein